jgi:hypothetical protein
MLNGDSDKNGGSEPIDLVVRKVTVTPVRAHVGDVVRVEMEWDYWGDITEDYYDTSVAAVRANGSVVASKTYTADFGGVSPGDTYRETFLWNTKGMAPGEYRIRGEVPIIPPSPGTGGSLFPGREGTRGRSRCGEPVLA